MIRYWGLFLALLVLLAGCGGTKASSGSSNNSGNNTNNSGNTSGSGSTGSTSGSGSTGSVAIQHVVIVVFENTDYSSVIGNSSALPYFNQLAQQYSQASQFYANVHPSIGNYFWMTAGQDPSATAQNPGGDPDNYTGTVSGDNVASELTAAGLTWKVYAQSLPSTGYTGTDVFPYVKRHNPFVYFDSVLASPSQLANVVHFAQFGTDLSSGSLPSYSFIVPDVVHDGHNCPDGLPAIACDTNDRLAEVDSFLKSDLSPLLTNSSVMANTVVVLIFDESATDNTGGGGHVAAVLLGGPVKTNYQSNNTYQFPSLLRFSLQSLGVNAYPGTASSAAPMTEFLQ